jgi:hypothetical protein
VPSEPTGFGRTFGGQWAAASAAVGGIGACDGGAIGDGLMF